MPNLNHIFYRKCDNRLFIFSDLSPLTTDAVLDKYKNNRIAGRDLASRGVEQRTRRTRRKWATSLTRRATLSIGRLALIYPFLRD